MLKNINCEEFEASESRIDTRYFGISSAKVILKKPLTPIEKQNELFEFLKYFDFIVITNMGNDPFNNHLLGKRTNAFQTDINIRFRKKVTENRITDDPSITIADQFPKNDQIVRIAESAFTYSRFLNDPNLPREKALLIYGDIVSNAFGKPDKYFLVSYETGIVTGFILFSNDKISLTSTIELIAVNNDFTRQGIGRALINAMEQHISELGQTSIIVGTQLNNISAVNFYFSLGFKYQECNSIYHYWPKLTQSNFPE